MLKRILAVLAILAMAVVVGCGGDDEPEETTSSGGSSEEVEGKVGVILPDTASSKRWEEADRKFLGEAFEAAGVDYDIQNAQGDKAKWATIADQLISGGATVLLLVNLDSPSAATVIKKAADQGIPSIDYDRLTLGGNADYYVSFDNVAVGTNIGEGLVKCMKENGDESGPVALLNGSPTDNNATLFKQGYEKAIKDAGYEIAADQSVPDWDNTKAGTIFEQMYTKVSGNLVGVASANDGLGGAVASVLKRNGDTEKVPTTGQDATTEGLQRVLLGIAVHDGLQGCQEGGRRCRRAGDRAEQAAIPPRPTRLPPARSRTPRPARWSSPCCSSRSRSSRTTSTT